MKRITLTKEDVVTPVLTDTDKPPRYFRYTKGDSIIYMTFPDEFFTNVRGDRINAYIKLLYKSPSEAQKAFRMLGEAYNTPMTEAEYKSIFREEFDKSRKVQKRIEMKEATQEVRTIIWDSVYEKGDLEYLKRRGKGYSYSARDMKDMVLSYNTKYFSDMKPKDRMLIVKRVLDGLVKEGKLETLWGLDWRGKEARVYQPVEGE